MNWIPITPETEIEPYKEVLMFNTANDVCMKGWVSENGEKYFIAESSYMAPFTAFTHYCIITGPTV